jgi:prevent-host-death family protein
MPALTLHVPKANLSKLMERVEKGEEIVIIRDGRPVPRLLPIDLPAYVRRRRAFGILKGKLQLPDSFFAPLTDAELKAWDRG